MYINETNNHSNPHSTWIKLSNKYDQGPDLYAFIGFIGFIGPDDDDLN